MAEEPREMKVALHSDGTLQGTRVFDVETGALIPVCAIHWSASAGQFDKLILELVPHEVKLIGPAEVRCSNEYANKIAFRDLVNQLTNAAKPQE